LSTHFYKAFEDRFRGTRGLIQSRLHIYQAFIEPLSRSHPAGAALDLGCGRGEWLELLVNHGFTAKGIDLDAGMLQACQALNLNVQQGDALDYLQAQPDQSHVIVSAFHVVEHIKFEQLENLVNQALRVLKPGGLLIMETPNAENIRVATHSFYLDPSHEKPIPSELLIFMAEYAGFETIKLLRLQESPPLRQKVDVNLQDVLGGVSPDYAVIARKKPDGVISSKTPSDPFDQDYGLSLDNLSSRWDARIARIEAFAQQAQMQSEQACQRAKEAQSESLQAQEHAKQLLEHAQQSQQQLNAILTSKSWRFTAPLRLLMQLIKHLRKP
jgi:2-polyprenyl-3-methyl-5-hydroxy-6-metoxy-1,4-benzoquinol methylase